MRISRGMQTTFMALAAQGVSEGIGAINAGTYDEACVLWPIKSDTGRVWELEVHIRPADLPQAPLRLGGPA